MKYARSERMLVILFVFLPILETAILLLLGKFLGAFKTFCLVSTTTILGILSEWKFLISALSQKTAEKELEDISKKLDAQEKLSAIEIKHLSQICAETTLYFIALVLFITPGFITDLIGFSLQVPFIKPKILKRIIYSFEDEISSRETEFRKKNQKKLIENSEKNA